MPSLLASLSESFAGYWQSINMSMLLSVASSCLTGYFWLVKMNQERAGLRLYRLADFRPDRLQCSDVPGTEKATWYGEVILANPSTLPGAVVRFQVELFWKGRWLPGKLVMEKKDDVPWTVEPLRVLNRSFGCAFAVDQGTTREQLLKPHRLRFTFVTVDGRKNAQEIVTCQSAAAPALAA